MVTSMSKKRRLIALIIDILLSASFVNIWVDGGHIAVPFGLIMVGGFIPGLPGTALGYVGLGLLMVVIYVKSVVIYIEMALIGLIALLASLYFYHLHYQVPVLTIVSSIPFMVLFLARLVYLRLQTMPDPAPPRPISSAPGAMLRR
jgi:hypothetical protein